MNEKTAGSSALASPVLGSRVDMVTLAMPNKPVLTSGDKTHFAAIVAGASADPGLCVIANRYPWQARIAAEKLLDVAQEKKLPIRVLSGQCHEGFYNPDFAQRLKQCHARGCDVRILVWQESTDGISASLLNLAKEGIIGLRVSGTKKFENTVPHFMLVGNSAFRQEAGHIPFNNQTKFSDTEPQVPARIDFNDPVTGKVLCELFDNFWG